MLHSRFINTTRFCQKHIPRFFFNAEIKLTTKKMELNLPDLKRSIRKLPANWEQIIKLKRKGKAHRWDLAQTLIFLIH